MYKLDTKAARSADAGGSSIKEMGKYIGEITQARELISPRTGAQGIEFAFKSQAGQKANLSIYTMSQAGDHYQGYDLINAMMTCMGLRSVAPVHGVATKYDFSQRKDVEEECNIFPDLCKPVGVLLETEDYSKNNGETATRIVLKSVFQASTELTATEILERKTEPVMLARMVAGLKHKPLKVQAAPEYVPPAQSYSAPPAGVSAPAASGFDTMDDDIPFATSSMYYDMTTSKQRRMGKFLIFTSRT